MSIADKRKATRRRKSIARLKRKLFSLESSSDPVEGLARPSKTKTTSKKGLSRKSKEKIKSITLTTTNSSASVTNNIKNRSFCEEFQVASCNVRTLCNDDKLYELVYEAIKFQWGILGIIEHRRVFPTAMSQPCAVGRGWKWLLLSAEKGSVALTSQSQHGSTGGIGLLISPKWMSAFIGFDALSSRVLVVHFRVSIGKLHVIVFYGHPATGASVEKNKPLYDSMTNFINNTPKSDIVLILCDANATLPVDGDRVRFGPQEKQNNNSSAFSEFIEASDTYPLNARFRKSNYYTFWGPKGRRARLDYILVHGKWANCFSDAFVHPLRFSSSDHAAVVVKGKWRLRQQKKTKGAPRLDFSVLKQSETAAQLVDIMGTLSDASLNDKSATFTSNFQHACKSMAIPNIKSRQQRIPWENEHVSELRLARIQAKAAFVKRRSPKNKDRLVELHYAKVMSRLSQTISNNSVASRLNFLIPVIPKRPTKFLIPYADGKAGSLTLWLERPARSDSPLSDISS